MQQTVEILTRKLELLGAEKQGTFCVDCETYHTAASTIGSQGQPRESPGPGGGCSQPARSRLFSQYRFQLVNVALRELLVKHGVPWKECLLWVRPRLCPDAGGSRLFLQVIAARFYLSSWGASSRLAARRTPSPPRKVRAAVPVGLFSPLGEGASLDVVLGEPGKVGVRQGPACRGRCRVLGLRCSKCPAVLFCPLTSAVFPAPCVPQRCPALGMAVSRRGALP